MAHLSCIPHFSAEGDWAEIILMLCFHFDVDVNIYNIANAFVVEYGQSLTAIGERMQTAHLNNAERVLLLQIHGSSI